MNRTGGMVGLLGVLMTFSGGARAQSFDCTKATTPTEHAISDSHTLSNLDMKMATL